MFVSRRAGVLSAVLSLTTSPVWAQSPAEPADPSPPEASSPAPEDEGEPAPAPEQEETDEDAGDSEPSADGELPPPPPYETPAPPPGEQPVAPAAPASPPEAEGAPPPDSATSAQGQASSDVKVTLAGEMGVDVAPDDAEADDYDKGVPPRLPWRGTAFSWGHTVTTTALGVGQSAIGRDHEQYTQSFSWLLNYYLVDYQRFKLRMAVAPSFDVELTNSNSTTDLREPQLNDLPVSFVASTPLYSKKGSSLSTGLLGNYTTIFPLSETSQGTGQYLVTSPRLLVFQSVPLFGKDAPVLQAMAFGISARWDHTFRQAYYPVNSRIQRPRGDFQGNTFTDDNLSGNPLAHDSLRFGAFLFFSEEIFGDPLWITTAFAWVNDYIYDVDEDYCHIVNGECIMPIGLEDPTDVRTRTGFSAVLTYFPEPEVGISLGYANASNHLAPDGTRRNPFYSPDATFTASIAFSIDALYERMTGPKRSQPLLLVGKRKPRRNTPTSVSF